MQLERIREKMEKEGIDCLIITEEPNFLYAIGEEAAGYLFITQEDIDMIVPRAYRYSLKEYDPTTCFTREEYKEAVEEKAEQIEGRVVADTDQSKTLNEKLDAEKTGFMTEIRKIKTAQEIKKIAEACKITDKAIQNLRKDLFTGINEFEALCRLKKFYCDNGVNESFLTGGDQSIVRANLMGAHGAPRQREIKEDDLVIVDTGARYQYYCADTTRTFCESPSEEQKRLFEAVKQIQQEELDMIHAGLEARKLKEREIEMTSELGYEPDKHLLYYSHSIGIEVHESGVRLSQDSEDVLEEGMVLTIEPGLHVPGIGGVRIEDTVEVTSKGVNVLNSAPKKL